MDNTLGIEDLRRLLPPERVRELSKLRPLRPLRDALFCWFIIVSAWFLVWACASWWAVLIAIPIIGNRYYALFIIGHDGLHRRICDSMRRNDFFGDLLVFAPIFAITRINNKNHLAHHRSLTKGHDPDLYKYTCVNKNSMLSLVSYIVGALSLFRGMRNVFLAKSEEADAHGGMGGAGYRWKDLALILGWQCVLLTALTLAIGWWAYPVLWLLPLFVFMFLADNLRTFLEHGFATSDAEAPPNRLITYRAPWWEKILLSPMNMNYHATHHLWPSIPYYNLSIADEELYQASRPDGKGLLWRSSYVAFLLSYFASVPIKDCFESA